ncbi:DNA-directed RNA polymerase subunit beta' [Candidatus Karelsulcia muelleri]
MIKQVSIAIASPEEILKESYGEVVKAETINYRTYRPEPDGLFCERIFGPTKNYECYCGKYKNKRYKGVVCNTCGVKITNNKVRRERLGHISLVSPIIHIWFFRGFPNKLANLLNWQTDEVEQVIYSEKYVLLDKGDLEDQLFFIKTFDLIGYRIYKKIIKIIKRKKPKKPPIIKTGAQAFDKIFKIINIKQLKRDLNEENKILRSNFQKQTLKYQLKTLSDFIKGKKSYKNIILKIIPVIPPEIRPLVQLDNGKFATSDFNELYRRLIIRNNRLKKFITIRVPQIIIRNERRLLQESVDSLFDNSNKIIPLRSENNRVIKSLSDTFKGKLGIFRFNLLGKRVDYSGRSVIISGPNLKLYECGLPREMLIELFRPYLLKKIIEIGETKTFKEAQEIISKKKLQTYKLLNKLIYKYPILLNRAPTLHKLGIQAFYPKINDGKAIELHPLVCAGFNADFDGDQMAVHIPLSNKAILEAKLLLFPSQNILNPANGNAILVPSQDMLLGLYYLTNEVKKKTNKLILFSSSKEVQIAYNNKIVDIHSKILLRIKKNKIISSTVGRVLFNLLLPKKVGYYNKIITKTSLSKIIKNILLKTNNYETIQFLDKIKEIGFEISFQAGISFNLEDLIIPDLKKTILTKALKTQKIINHKSDDNNIRYKTNIKFWSLINNKITKEIINYLKTSQNGLNPIYMMLNSGARSSIEQIRQIAGMRGLMAKPQKNIDEGKNIIENPIYSNFLEGLSNFEYFISTHGARKGLADTALKTADAGYLTRRLVDVAQNVIIKEEDCNTLLGIYVTPLIINNKIVEPLDKRCLGRISLQSIYDKNKRKYIIKKDELINDKIAKLIKTSNLDKIQVRSPLTCQAKNGICRKCYGINLSTGELVQKGVAVGILAAQSIGEPGTQLTLRTFHIGGTAGNIAETNKILSNYDGKINYRNIKYIKRKNYKLVVSKDAKIIMSNFNGDQIIRINIPYGCKLFLKNKQNIKKSDIIYKCNPDYYPIISENNCKVILHNFYQEINYMKTTKPTGQEEIIIKRNIHNNLIPSMILININKNKNQVNLTKYLFPTLSKILVKNLERVKQGKLIAKIPRKLSKSTDITGGLPRVSELLETRKPLNSSIISEIGGLIHFGRIKRKKQEIFIIYKKVSKKKYNINIDKKILVNEKEKVKAGTQLSEGEIAIKEILTIKGIHACQKYLINEIQEIYRLEGVKIDDKHFEIIIRQMLKKVKIIQSGDTDLLVGEIIDKEILEKENNKITNYKIIISNVKYNKYLIGDKIDKKNLNKIKEKQHLKTRETLPAIGQPILQGITKSALQNKSFLSAASFQETTKILSESALKRQKDYLTGVKENVILGNKIPVGTGYND